jgi:hypothetical protein
MTVMIKEYDRAIKNLTETEYPETQALIKVYWGWVPHDIFADPGEPTTVPAKSGCRLLFGTTTTPRINLPWP